MMSLADLEISLKGQSGAGAIAGRHRDHLPSYVIIYRSYTLLNKLSSAKWTAGPWLVS